MGSTINAIHGASLGSRQSGHGCVVSKRPRFSFTCIVVSGLSRQRYAMKIPRLPQIFCLALPDKRTFMGTLMCVSGWVLYARYSIG